MPDTLTDADIAQAASPAAPATLSDADIDNQHQQASGWLDSIERFGKGLLDKTVGGPVVGAVNAVKSLANTSVPEARQALANAPASAVQAAKDAYHTHAQMLQQAKDSLAKGDYDDAIQRGTNALIPVLGPSIQASVDKANGGDMPGGLGELTGDLASVLAAAPGAPEAVASAAGDLATAAKGAAKGAVEGAKASTKLPAVHIGPMRMQLDVPLPATISGAAAGGAIGAHYGGMPGAAVGATVGAAAPIAKGAWQGAKAALTAKISAAASAADDARAAQMARVTDAFDPATAARTDINLGNQPSQGPIPASRQLPAAQQPITAGPIPDTSRVTVTTGNPLSYGGPRQLGPGPAPQPTVIPPAKPEIPSAVYEAAARAEKAQKLAQFLHSGGISAEEAKAMTGDHWQMAAKGAGVNAPSLSSQGQAMFELRRLEAAQNSPQLMERLKSTGSMPAAQQLQQLMGQ